MAGIENRPPARANGASTSNLGDCPEATQRRPPSRSTREPVDLTDTQVVAKIWKSARNRSQTIVLALKEYNGHQYLDVRQFETNAGGRSIPTIKGIAVSRLRLSDFFAAVRKAEARAIELGLVDGDPS